MANNGKATFRRLGRSLHLRITTAEDLARVAELDEAHWVATGAPIETLNCDAVFLRFVDTDKNGRIMCFEIREAIGWLGRVLRDTSGVTRGEATLRLDTINTDDEQGRRIHQAAVKMFQRLGLDEASGITLQQVRDITATISRTSGDETGVVAPADAESPDMKQFISDIVATVGGDSGVGEAQLGEFISQARACLDWMRQAGGGDESDIMPLGPATHEAFARYASLRDKVDQYFAQCAAVAFDDRLAQQVTAAPDSLDMTDPNAIDAYMAAAPLASPRGDSVLSVADRINPHYEDALRRLMADVIRPVLKCPAEMISRAQWRSVKQFFAAHEKWSASNPAASVAPLGHQTLEKYLDAEYHSRLGAMIADRTEAALATENVRLVEKLILYQANLLALANNFVSFPHLYDPSRRAMFETGTLIVDGRRLEFCVHVADRAAHAAVARTGNMFVVYARVTPADQDAYEVAAAVTSGGKGNLCLSKRGVFRDVVGREADARIVEIIENPISLTEAIVSPFGRLGRLLSGKIEAITASAEKKFDASASGVLDKVSAPTATAAAQPNRGMMAGGLLMGGGVVLAALGSAMAYIAKALSGIGDKWWIILVVIGAAMLAVIGPTVILAITKLRRRDLSAILEGSGWAINAPMRLTGKQGRAFTKRPLLPGRGGLLGRKCFWTVLAIAAVAAITLAVWACASRDTPTPATKPTPAPAAR